MGRETWEIVSRKKVSDHNVIPVTCTFKFKRKHNCTIRKFKSRYCVRGDFQKILSPEPFKLYSPVVQWATVRLMLIFQCIIVLQSQCIDFKSAFSKAGIPIRVTVSIENTRDFKSDGSQCDVVPRLNKSVYCQAGDARPWCEKLLFFVISMFCGE